MTANVLQLGYVGLGCSNPAEWEAFAADVLGLSVRESNERHSFLRMDEYQTRIILDKSLPDDLLYAGWLVAGPTELGQVRESLSNHGATITQGTKEEIGLRGVQDMFCLEDPDGLRTEIAYGATRSSRPFVPGRPLSGFKAGEQGLGHIVVRVSSRAESERFYTNLLGMRVSDYGSGRLAFLHCNARHHSIAFAPRNIIPGDTRLVHLMLEVKSIDDVGTAMDICEKKGYFVAESLGRHTNDKMISFYVDSPNGLQIEYGFGAREIPQSGWAIDSFDRKDVWGHRLNERD